jgi:uncharacterized phiE125 gp8 family phage protein
MSAWTLLSRAGPPPVALPEARAYARISDGEDDHLLGHCLAAAIGRVEAETGCALTVQTWRVTADLAHFRPEGAWSALPAQVRPLRAVLTASVMRTDTSDIPIPPDAILADTDGEAIRIRTEALTASGARVFRPVRLDVECGYAPGHVPEPIRAAILALTAFGWERDGAPDAPALASLTHVAAMLAPFRRVRL